MTEEEKQIRYRDARAKGWYDDIWKTVGKCVFCDLRDKYIFHEENGVAMVVPLYAYIDGQIMIVPRRHVRSPKDLTSKEWETIRKMFYLAKKLIRDTHGIKGMQIVQKDGATAQGTVEHLHFHCIPFDAPDLCQWHYRTLKNTPLENAQLYQSQSAKIQTLSKRFAGKYGSDPNSKKHVITNITPYIKPLKRLAKTVEAKLGGVACFIIKNNAIISSGLNHNPTGGPMEIEKDGKLTTSPDVIHAEIAAITAARQNHIDLTGATLLLTMSPCLACAKQIAKTGIAQLCYLYEWWDQASLELLRQHGIKTTQIKEEK